MVARVSLNIAAREGARERKPWEKENRNGILLVDKIVYTPYYLV